MTRAAHVTANTLRAHRLQLGLEQREVVDRLAVLAAQQDYGEIGLDAHAVSRHERGVHRPSRRYRKLYGLLFGVDEDALWPRPVRCPPPQDPVLTAAWSRDGTVEACVALAGRGGPVERRAFLLLAGTALTAPAHQWLIQEPGELAAALHGDRVTPALAGRLPAMIEELRRMDDAHDPAVVLSLAEREFAWVAGLLDNGSYDEPTGRRLHLALAEIGQVVGYLAYDRGDHVRAQRSYLTSLRAAHLGGDRLLGSHILKCMAEQAVELGRPQDALILLDTALAGLRGAEAARQSALLHSWKARAHAALGGQRECTVAIDSARTQAERGHGVDGPSWLYWFSTADLVSKAGEAFLDAGLFGPAERLLREGIAALPAERHLGDQQMFLAQLAIAQVHNDSVDAGLRTGHRALDLATLRPSRRATGRIHQLCRQLAARADNTCVVDFLDRVTASSAA